MKKYLKFLIRLLITILMVILLVQKTKVSEVYETLKNSNLLYVSFASILYILSSYISTLRWKIFIFSLSIKTSMLFSLYMIGSFFNIILPGIISGDLIKILIFKDRVSFKEAVFSVFMDRYIGLAVLLMIGFLFFFISYSRLPKNWIIWIVPLSFLCFIIISLFLFRLINLRFLKEFKPFIASLRKNQIFKALLLSLFVQLCVILSVYVIALSLEIKISFLKIVVFLPIIILITTLPISISGIGLREWSFILFFGNFISAEKAVAISILWFLSTAFASLIGGFEYLRMKDLLNINQKKKPL